MAAKGGRGGRVGGTPATMALSRAGIMFTLHPYDHDPRAASYGLEAATALGLEPAMVFKTLMATVDGALVVGVVPVTGQLDLKALARALGGARAAMADLAAAERATGYVAGGISPIGQRRAHSTVLDTSALDHTEIFVSAGRRGLDLGIAPDDLVRVTSAVIAPIGRG
ncbi:MAG: Cys-tRNA(Pro) deacylase [Nocardioides sp.]